MKAKKWFSCVVIVAMIAPMLFGCSNKTCAYERIVQKGYTGTREEFIASLVGETVIQESDFENESAFALAKSKGYRGSFNEWAETLTGSTANEHSASTYSIAQKNGYASSLSDWLTELMNNPDDLGVSDGETQSAFELACEYGFQGTYIEWLVSLVSK